jgi:hypothetical protein
LRGRQTKKSKFPLSPVKIIEIDYKHTPKLCVHYQNGADDAKRGFKPTWFDDEATEWKCIERDAYRAGYRTIIK